MKSYNVFDPWVCQCLTSRTDLPIQKKIFSGQDMIGSYVPQFVTSHVREPIRPKLENIFPNSPEILPLTK